MDYARIVMTQALFRLQKYNEKSSIQRLTMIFFGSLWLFFTLFSYWLRLGAEMQNQLCKTEPSPPWLLPWRRRSA